MAYVLIKLPELLLLSCENFLSPPSQPNMLAGRERGRGINYSKTVLFFSSTRRGEGGGGGELISFSLFLSILR